jgi:type IV pilus assembly protein PilA
MLFSRLSSRHGRRGFTMMELLITLSMMTVLSVLALLGFRKYLHASQSSEARAVLGQIRNGEESYKAEMLKYLSVSSSMTDYYPNATPNDLKYAWNRPGDARFYSAGPPANGWQLLGVNPDGPVRYGYVVMAGVAPAGPPAPDPSFISPPHLTPPSTAGAAWFVAGARNEHFTQSFRPSLALTTSYDGTIYWEGESD